MTPPDDIIAAAQAAQRKWGVPAAISIAQWALESGWGKHLPLGSFNPFGIKARAGDPSVTVPTREVIAGKSVVMNAAFRKFASFSEAFDWHGELLAKGGAYAKARQYLHDDTAYADALTGHYATDPQYGTLLRAIMRGGNFQQYDVGAGK